MSRAFRACLAPSGLGFGKELLLQLVRPLRSERCSRGCSVGETQTKAAHLSPLAKEDPRALVLRLQLDHDVNGARLLEIGEHRLEDLMHQPVGNRTSLRFRCVVDWSDLKPGSQAISTVWVINHIAKAIAWKPSRDSIARPLSQASGTCCTVAHVALSVSVPLVRRGHETAWPQQAWSSQTGV